MDYIMKPYTLSVKTLIVGPDGQFLMLKRHETSGANAGKWDLAGGKPDGCETVEEALIRETKEETGLEITVRRVIGASESENTSNRIAYVIFESHASSGDVSLSHEHSDYIWIEKEGLASLDVCWQFEELLKQYAAS